MSSTIGCWSVIRVKVSSEVEACLFGFSLTWFWPLDVDVDVDVEVVIDEEFVVEVGDKCKTS